MKLLLTGGAAVALLFAAGEAQAQTPPSQVPPVAPLSAQAQPQTPEEIAAEPAATAETTAKGVAGRGLRKVRRDNVKPITVRTLTTTGRNPEIRERLLTTVGNTVDTVGGVANTTLQPGGVGDNAVGTVGEV